MQRRTFLGMLGASALATLDSAWAQGYPNAPVKMIVPYAPGGGADAIARLLAQGMGEQLKQSFVVENRAGAGGMLGAEAAIRAVPDGYTVLVAGNPELTITPWLQPKTSYEPTRDLTPIVLISQSANVLVCHASLGATTLRKAFDAARAHPGGITVGTPGNGSAQHIALELLRAQTGLEIVHVPYKGAGPATMAVLGGQVSFALVGAPPLLPHFVSRKLVPLAVTQPKRSPLLANVPTLGEAMGIMRDGDFVTWYGLLVPSRTPAEAVNQLEKAAKAVLDRPNTRAQYAELGTDLIGLPKDEFTERMRSERKRYGELVKRFNISGA